MPKERTLEDVIKENEFQSGIQDEGYMIVYPKRLAQAIRLLLLGEIERARVFTLNQGEKYLEQAEIKKIVSEL